MEIINELRQTLFVGGVMVVALYLWVVHDAVRKGGLRNRLLFAISVLLYVGGRTLESQWWVQYRLADSPEWMTSHPLVAMATLAQIGGVYIQIGVGLISRVGYRSFAVATVALLSAFIISYQLPYL